MAFEFGGQSGVSGADHSAGRRRYLWDFGWFLCVLRRCLCCGAGLWGHCFDWSPLPSVLGAWQREFPRFPLGFGVGPQDNWVRIMVQFRCIERLAPLGFHIVRCCLGDAAFLGFQRTESLPPMYCSGPSRRGLTGAWTRARWMARSMPGHDKKYQRGSSGMTEGQCHAGVVLAP